MFKTKKICELAEIKKGLKQVHIKVRHNFSASKNESEKNKQFSIQKSRLALYVHFFSVLFSFSPVQGLYIRRKKCTVIVIFKISIYQLSHGIRWNSCLFQHLYADSELKCALMFNHSNRKIFIYTQTPLKVNMCGVGSPIIWRMNQNNKRVNIFLIRLQWFISEFLAILKNERSGQSVQEFPSMSI